MWIYIPLECPPAKTRLLKRTETVTIDIDIILIIGFQKKKVGRAVREKFTTWV